jgi:hypothetical protein
MSLVTELRMHPSQVKVCLLAMAASLGLLAQMEESMAGHVERAFTGFSGSWRGSGRVTTTDGRTESITCRAHYDVSQSGASLSQLLVCASDSFRFEIHSDVVADGRSAQGGWQESTRNVSGNLIGHIDNGVFDGSVDGPGFTAGVVLKTSGRRQAVTITPHAGDIATVGVELLRQS